MGAIIENVLIFSISNLLNRSDPIKPLETVKTNGISFKISLLSYSFTHYSEILLKRLLSMKPDCFCKLNGIFDEN